MKKILITLTFVSVIVTVLAKKNYNNIRAFTHPLDIRDSISIYHFPNIYNRELGPDEEAGWIVNIKNKVGNYFQVDIEDLGMSDIWVHIGDIGVVVENYDSLAIPIYMACDTVYVFNTCIGLLYDIQNDLLLIQLFIDNNYFFGWIDKKHVCGNPYTTCG